MRFHIFKNELGIDTALNLDKCFIILKGSLCDKEPTIEFWMEKNNATQIFKTVKERDEIFDKITKE